MLLYQWRGATRNFGDELNALIWPRLLPDFFDNDPAQLFLGIGSVLDSRHSPHARKIVAGAGYGGYEGPPSLDDTWTIHWVRGPRTARQLGLPEQLGLGDPAILLPHHPSSSPPHPSSSRRRGPSATAPNPTAPIGFMPHFESLQRGAWHAAAKAAGLHLIDPRNDPADIISAIGHCRVLLSEAMHGVIVADTLRVPWIALQPLLPIHRAKWHDWADTLALHIEFRPLTPSTLLERLHASRLPSRRIGRDLLDASSNLLYRMALRRFIDRAATALAKAAAAAPQLSDAQALDRCQARMLARLDLLRRDPRSGGARCSGLASPAQNRLPTPLVRLAAVARGRVHP